MPYILSPKVLIHYNNCEYARIQAIKQKFVHVLVTCVLIKNVNNRYSQCGGSMALLPNTCAILTVLNVKLLKMQQIFSRYTKAKNLYNYNNASYNLELRNYRNAQTY